MCVHVLGCSVRCEQCDASRQPRWEGLIGAADPGADNQRLHLWPPGNQPHRTEHRTDSYCESSCVEFGSPGTSASFQHAKICSICFFFALDWELVQDVTHLSPQEPPAHLRLGRMDGGLESLTVSIHHFMRLAFQMLLQKVFVYLCSCEYTRKINIVEMLCH